MIQGPTSYDCLMKNPGVENNLWHCHFKQHKIFLFWYITAQLNAEPTEQPHPQIPRYNALRHLGIFFQSLKLLIDYSKLLNTVWSKSLCGLRSDRIELFQIFSMFQFEDWNPARVEVRLFPAFVKGIVSWNKMKFGLFCCTAGNFLMIRWRILNFKISRCI
jgi:hypothetical protein